MPDERFIHPGEGESDKLTQLSDFEHRVWIAYKLAANDVGVMVDSPVPVQNINRYLRNPQRTKDVRKALDAMLRLELLIRFRHGGEHYLCSPLWQDWQSVKYPRETHLPLPDDTVRGRCSDVTQKLFELLESKRKAKREKLLKDSEPLGSISKNSESTSESSGVSEENSLHGRAGNANALAHANAHPSEGEPEREARPGPQDIPRGQAELTADALVAEWNMRVKPPLVAVSDAPASRGRILSAVRLRPSLDEWRDVLDRAFASEFLMGRAAGRDGGTFRLTFWWLLEDTHADKVLAGAYDNRSKPVDVAVAKDRDAHEAERKRSAAILANVRRSPSAEVA